MNIPHTKLTDIPAAGAPVRRLVLASASPQRRALLKRIVPDFDIAAPAVDEAGLLAELAGLPPAAQAVCVARAKVWSVAPAYSSEIVLGCDTLVALHGNIFGKPASADQARAMLADLRGTRHTVISGVCLLDLATQRELTQAVTTIVTMANISDSQIQAYVDSGEPFGKAGSYAIQETGDRFVTRVDGDFDNVVGLPVAVVGDMLRELCAQ